MTQNNYLSVRHANFWRLVYLVVFLPLEKSFQQKHLNFSERQRCWKKFILKLQENEDINFLPFLQHYTELTLWAEIFHVIYHLNKFLVALWDWELESETMLIMRKNPLLNCIPKSPKTTRMTNLRTKNCKSRAMSCLKCKLQVPKIFIPK